MSYRGKGLGLGTLNPQPFTVRSQVAANSLLDTGRGWQLSEELTHLSVNTLEPHY
jgi:hypothetical protein